MNARKIFLIIGVCILLAVCALVAISLYMVQSKETKENSDRTAKARAARWATKEQEPTKENAENNTEPKQEVSNDEVDKLS